MFQIGKYNELKVVKEVDFGNGVSSASEKLLITAKWNAIIADLKQKVDTFC